MKKELMLSSLSSPYDRQALSALFNVMSPRYILYAPANDILEHVDLYKNLTNEDFVWKVEKTPDLNTRRVTICAKDRPGLFSKFAGIFTLNHIDILDAQIYTWRNNTALDIFEVKPPPDQLFEVEHWSRAEANLKSVLCGDLDLVEMLRKRTSNFKLVKPHTDEKPHRITVDNQSSSFFTIIEVFTYDFPGLLFNVTDAIYRCGLDIRIAKIATNVDQVVDVFYVRDLYGQKVDDPNQVSIIKSAIMGVLPSL
jgi:[protein-PII] uridylyltransferase